MIDFQKVTLAKLWNMRVKKRKSVTKLSRKSK